MFILNASDYYVATYGSDENPGTFAHPFRNIQRASEIMTSGDICYIRQGVYHEVVTLNDQDGANGSEIVFTNFNDERVAMDGTVSIDSVWQVYSGNIWKTTLDFDIWQLFVDRNEMVMARWPNANFSDGSIWDKENYWGHGTIDQDPEAYGNGTLIDEPHGNVNLAGSGLDITDAIAILNVGSFKTWSRRVLTHSGNTFTYDPVPAWKTKHHDYFLEGKLEFLDADSEWFFDPETKELYFWAPGGEDPNHLQIRGKVQSYAFEVTNSDYVTIKNLEFFGTTFKFTNSDYGLVDGCNLYYPSSYKRMLGVVDTIPDMSIFLSSSYCKVIRSAFRYTDGAALEMYSGNNTIEDCYFYHIDYTATDLNGLMTTIQMGGAGNIFRRNTLHKLGASATLNPGDAALIEFNDMYDSGYMQSDGSLIQCMVGQQPGVEIRYNWLHDTIKYGARFDGNGSGNNGLMHHNVIWNVQGGIMIKGYEHNLYNNTAFDNGDKNDIIVMIDQGGNEGTITRNNAANKIAGHRSGTYGDYPVPGTYDHNWNGYETGGDIKNHLIDPENYDFRPHPDSSLVDAGMIVEGITGGYFGEAPDIGAYENGGEMWVPGITWDVSTLFGDDYVAPDPMHNGPVWHVSNSGSNNYDGSIENPFATIQFAYDRANENDTILVHPGTFYGTNWFNGKSVVLASFFITTNDTGYINNTIIDGDSSNCPLAIVGNIDSTCRVTGFTIQNGIGCVYGQGAGIYIEGSSPRLDHLVVRDNHGGTNGGGICLNGSSYSVMNEITIENNSSEYGGGIYSYYSEPTITNCTIKNNQASLGAGIYFATSNPNLEFVSILDNHANNNGGGIYCTDYSIPTFNHITIANNVTSSGGGIYCSVNSNPTLLNSILWSNSPEEIIMSTGSLTATYSIIGDGWDGEGNIDADPLFCNPDSGDYTLAANSPALGAGDDGTNMGAFGVGCPIQVDWDFSLSEPVITVMGSDDLWNPGDTISVEMDFCNNTDVAHNWYPGVTIESDSSLTSLHTGHVWFYAMSAGTCHEISFSVFADSSIIADTIVTFTAYPEALNCQNQPGYCIDGDTLTFDVPIVVHAVSSNTKHFIPQVFALYQNYPNPFNPTTTIDYDLPEDALVNITLYDMMGKIVKNLVSAQQNAGFQSVRWNSTNNNGQSVSAGVYFYRIEAGDFMQTNKMLLIK